MWRRERGVKRLVVEDGGRIVAGELGHLEGVEMVEAGLGRRLRGGARGGYQMKVCHG
jgi:hypothetical protein